MPVNLDLYDESGFRVLSPNNKILQKTFSFLGDYVSTSSITTKIPMFMGTANVTFRMYATLTRIPDDWYTTNEKTGIFLVSGSDNALYFISKNGVAVDSTAAVKQYTYSAVGEYWTPTSNDSKYFYVKDQSGNLVWSFERLLLAPYIVCVLELTPNSLVTFASPNNRKLYVMQSSIPGSVNVNTSNNTIFEWSGIAIKWSNGGKTVTLGYQGESYKTAQQDLQRTSNKIKILIFEFGSGT